MRITSKMRQNQANPCKFLNTLPLKFREVLSGPYKQMKKNSTSNFKTNTGREFFNKHKISLV